MKKREPPPGEGRDLDLETFSPLPVPPPRELMGQFLDPARGVLIIDRELRVRSVNRAFEDALGSHPGLPIGKSLGEVLPCRRAMKGGPACETSPACLGCECREIALAAIARGETRRSLARLGRLSRGESQEAALKLCAAPLELSGEQFAVLAVEDLSNPRRQERIDTTSHFQGMVGQDPQMLRLFDTVRQVGPIDVPVLIQGESGTGKEMVARALHRESSRRHRPLVIVNGVALAGGLLESELFGHAKGAFSGATRDKPGRFELAQGGTIFLDEIGELAPEMQVKLLRVLQDGTFDRVGGEETIQANARILCATSLDLETEVEAGRFRLDLFYRLSVVVIDLPPLRQRAGDLPLLAEHLLSRAAREYRLPPPKLLPSTLAALAAHSWPGNVRELDNAMRRALVTTRGRSISLDLLAALGRGAPPSRARALGNRQLDLTPERIEEAVRAAQGNKSEAARRLEISRATLYRYLARQKQEDGS